MDGVCGTNGVDVVGATDEATGAADSFSAAAAAALSTGFDSEGLRSIGAVAGNGFRVSESAFSSFCLLPSSFIIAGDGFRVGMWNTTNISNKTAKAPPKAPSGHRAENQLGRLWVGVGSGVAPNVRFTSSCKSLRVAGCISKAGSACSRRFLA
jgi:hypothetical protein